MACTIRPCFNDVILSSGLLLYTQAKREQLQSFLTYLLLGLGLFIWVDIIWILMRSSLLGQSGSSKQPLDQGAQSSVLIYNFLASLALLFYKIFLICLYHRVNREKQLLGIVVP